jgi:hypothetical protein
MAFCILYSPQISSSMNKQAYPYAHNNIIHNIYIACQLEINNLPHTKYWAPFFLADGLDNFPL